MISYSFKDSRWSLKNDSKFRSDNNLLTSSTMFTWTWFRATSWIMTNRNSQSRVSQLENEDQVRSNICNKALRFPPGTNMNFSSIILNVCGGTVTLSRPTRFYNPPLRSPMVSFCNSRNSRFSILLDLTKKYPSNMYRNYVAENVSRMSSPKQPMPLDFRLV